MATVISIATSRNQSIREVLEYYLKECDAGRLRSLLLCAENVDGNEDISVVGGYRVRPALGAAAAVRVAMKLTQMEDARQAAGRPPRVPPPRPRRH